MNYLPLTEELDNGASPLAKFFNIRNPSILTDLSLQGYNQQKEFVISNGYILKYHDLPRTTHTNLHQSTTMRKRMMAPHPRNPHHPIR